LSDDRYPKPKNTDCNYDHQRQNTDDGSTPS
jgi:hypothetical protein